MTSIIVQRPCLYDIGHFMEMIRWIPLAPFPFIKLLIPFVKYVLDWNSCKNFDIQLFPLYVNFPITKLEAQ